MVVFYEEGKVVEVEVGFEGVGGGQPGIHVCKRLVKLSVKSTLICTKYYIKFHEMIGLFANPLYY